MLLQIGTGHLDSGRFPPSPVVYKEYLNSLVFVYFWNGIRLGSLQKFQILGVGMHIAYWPFWCLIQVIAANQGS